MRVYKIDVTEEDIRRGVRGSEHRCPIANAASRNFTGDYSVTPSHFVFGSFRDDESYFDDRVRAVLPRTAQKFISKFDNGGIPSPFRFYICM